MVAVVGFLSEWRGGLLSTTTATCINFNAQIFEVSHMTMWEDVEWNWNHYYHHRKAEQADRRGGGQQRAE